MRESSEMASASVIGPSRTSLQNAIENHRTDSRYYSYWQGVYRAC